MEYLDTFAYPPVEPVAVDGLEFTRVVYPAHAPLRFRREELGLSQQQVADLSGVTLRQYQRFETGERSMAAASLRTGLAICATLQLDPRRFVILPVSE